MSVLALKSGGVLQQSAKDPRTKMMGLGFRVYGLGPKYYRFLAPGTLIFGPFGP